MRTGASPRSFRGSRALSGLALPYDHSLNSSALRGMDIGPRVAYGLAPGNSTAPGRCGLEAFCLKRRAKNRDTGTKSQHRPNERDGHHEEGYAESESEALVSAPRQAQAEASPRPQADDRRRPLHVPLEDSSPSSLPVLPVLPVLLDRVAGRETKRVGLGTQPGPTTACASSSVASVTA